MLRNKDLHTISGPARYARRGLIITAGCLLLTVASLAQPTVATASDGSWVFGRSYYSHNPVQPVEIGRRSAGGPFYSRPQGEYVRSGFRQTRSSFNLPFGSGSGDRIIMNESWIQYGVQF